MTFTPEKFPLAKALLDSVAHARASVIKLKKPREVKNIAVMLGYGGSLGMSDDTEKIARTLKGEIHPDSHLFGLAENIIGINNCRHLRKHEIENSFYTGG